VPSRDNPKADWYVWADPSPMARRPTTGCRSSAARPGNGTGDRMQYYLHNFLTGAAGPELPQPRGAGGAAGRRALLAGSRGRRVPPRHDQLLLPRQGVARQSRARPDMRNATIAPEVNPYNWQDHLYDKNQPENLEFLRRFRALLTNTPPPPPWARSAMRSTGCRSRPNTPRGDKVHMCYSFEFLSGIERFSDAGRVGRGRPITRTPSATAGPAGRFPTTT
jgi:alpha-glucosidase